MENVIEFLKDEDIASVTFSQRRYITQIRKLAAKHPDQVEILAENEDGSIFAHVPVSWVKVRPPKEVKLSDFDRMELRSRFLRAKIAAKTDFTDSDDINNHLNQ